MAFVDDVEEHMSGVVAVGQIADLVDPQDCRVEVWGERLAEPTVSACCREIVDQVSRRDEAGRVSVLDGAVGDGDREVRLAAAGAAEQDGVATLADQLRGEVALNEPALEGLLE